MSNAGLDHRSGTSTSGRSSGSDSETMSPGPSFQNHQTQPTQEIQNHSTQNLPIQLPLSQNHQDKPSQRQKSQDKATHNQTPPTPDHPTQEDQNQDFSTTAGAEPFPVPRDAAVASTVSGPVSVMSDPAGSTEGSEAMQKEQNTEASGKKNSEPLVNGGLLPRSASILSRKQSSESLLVRFQFPGVQHSLFPPTESL